MKKYILDTDSNNQALLIARVGVALVILPHGLQKAFGSFGGYGFDASMQYFTESVGIPWILGFLVILAETLGTALLAAGFLTRIAGASLVLVMVGASAQQWQNGFFMNWFGNQAGEGIEFFLLAIGLALPAAIFGGGRWSIDAWLGEAHAKGKSRLPGKVEAMV